MAIAQEQEMKAKTQEMRANVVAAEAEVPKAMAEALRSGNVGVLDYYRMQNINADTALRNAIGGVGSNGTAGTKPNGNPDGKK